MQSTSGSTWNHAAAQPVTSQRTRPKFTFDAAEHRNRCARRQERGVADRVRRVALEADAGKRAAHEVTACVVRRAGQLASGVVVTIEGVVHLRKQFVVRVDLVPRTDVDHTVPRAFAAAQVVHAVRLVQIVLVAAHIGGADQVEVRVDGELAKGVVVRVKLEQVLRHLRQVIAGLDSDGAAIRDALATRQSIAVTAVAAAADGLRALVGCVQKGVLRTRVHGAGVRRGAGFHALAARLAEIGKVAEPGLLRCHEEQIVVVVRVEVSGCPAQATVRIAPYPKLVCAADHLFKRWIAHQRVGQ